MFKKVLDFGKKSADSDVKGAQFLNAVRMGQISALRALVSGGANIQFQDPQTGESALHIAVAKNDLDVLTFLIESGVNGALKNRKGTTPILLAVENNQQRVIKALVAKVENSGLHIINEAGETSVNVALRVSQLNVARFLVDHGEDVDAALRYAIKMNDWTQIEWICKHRGNPDLVDMQGLSPLNRSISQGDLEAFKKWVAFGADINGRQGTGKILRVADWTPLMMALDQKRGEIATFLLMQPKIDVLHMTASGVSAMTIALRMGLLDMVRLLRERGAELNIKTAEATTALMFAAQSGSRETLEYALRVDPELINAQDHIGWTALMFAIQARSLECVRFLIEKGADRNLESKDHKFSAHRVALIQKTRIQNGDVLALQQVEEIVKLLA